MSYFEEWHVQSLFELPLYDAYEEWQLERKELLRKLEILLPGSDWEAYRREHPWVITSLMMGT